MLRLFLIYVLLFAVISVPRASAGHWVLIPLGFVFAAVLALVGAGIARAVAIWPFAAPCVLLVNAGTTLAAFSILVGLVNASHVSAWVGIVVAVGGTSMVVIALVAVAGWITLR